MDDFRQVTDLDHASSDDTVRLARTAAEAVRGLNQAQQYLALINGNPQRDHKDQP